jgi:CHASE2 domain-containing sensor protein
VLIGALVPGLNLVVAGSIVAELEHAILRRPVERRPKPSRLVLAWWAAWVLDAVLMIVVIGWRFRDGVQAQADGVLLSGLLDTSGALLAGLTAIVVHRLTSLLAPITLDRLRVRGVVAVKGAPAPTLRPVRSMTSR